MDIRQVVLSIGLVSGLLSPCLGFGQGQTERVSVLSDGTEGNSLSETAAVSGDGRYVVFASEANNLVASDTNNVADIFIKDRKTAVITRISVDGTGIQGNGASSKPQISDSGRYIAYQSVASNLVAGDSNSVRDLFLYDRNTGATSRANVDSSGVEANAQVVQHSISADGSLISFSSEATNLVAGDTNGSIDIFLHEIQSGATTRGCTSSDIPEEFAVLLCTDHSLSANGQYLVFLIWKISFPPNDSESVEYGIYRLDRVSGSVSLVSVDQSGNPSLVAYDPAISPDGQFVAYLNRPPGSPFTDAQILVRDIQAAVTTLVSVDVGGVEGSDDSTNATFNADGRFVFFDSLASNLVSDDTNGVADVFVRDRKTARTSRLSLATDGSQGNSGSGGPKVSGNGRYVTFTSGADNLVPDDTNAASDVFLHDRWPHDDLTPSGVAAGDRAGSSVDIDGPYALVGVRLDDHSTYTNAGSAAVYRRHPTTGVWSLIRTLLPTLDSSTDQDKFGHAVALDANTLAVSAENDDDAGFRAGKVYIFGRNVGGTNNWGLVKSFTGTDTTASDYFGRTLALDGDRLAVGAHLTDAGGNARGAVYVFERNAGGTDNWGQTQKLLASDGVAGDRFGSAIGLHGDHLIVGVSRKTTGAGAAAGQAYVFRHNGASWIEQRILLPASGQVANDQYGYSVDINGSTAVVGARFTDATAGNQTGSAYVYGQHEGGADNWGQLGEIEASDAAAGDRFGSAVSIAGNRIVVGSPLQDDNGADAGKVYVYDLAMTELDQLTNEQVTLRDEFGSAVSTDGVQCLVGSWLDNRPGNNSGAAYRFDVN